MIRAWPVQLALLIAGFAAGTVVALLFGAADLGTVMAFGQLAFAATLVWVLLRA